MAKKITSYTAPFCGVCTLIICDYVVIMMNWSTGSGATIFIIIYNVFLVLALWSYFGAMWSDPGFVPLEYEYNLSKMSRLTAALYHQSAKYQNEKIDITLAGGNF